MTSSSSPTFLQVAEPEVGILCDLFKQILLACREIVLCTKLCFHPQHGMTFMNIDAYDQLMIDGVVSVSNFEWFQITEPIDCTYFIEGVIKYISKYVKDVNDSIMNIFPRSGIIRVMHRQSKQILYSYDPQPLMRSVCFRPEQLALFGPGHHMDRMGLLECSYSEYAEWLVEVQKTMAKQLLIPALVDDYMIHTGMLLPSQRKDYDEEIETIKKTAMTSEECQQVLRRRPILFSYANGHDVMCREIVCDYVPFCCSIDDVRQEQQQQKQAIRNKILQYGFSFEIRHKQQPKLRGNGYSVEHGQIRDLTCHAFMLRQFSLIFNAAKQFDHRKNKMDWMGLSSRYGFVYVIPILFHGVSTEDQFNRLTQDKVVQEPSFIRFRQTHIPTKVRAHIRDDLYRPELLSYSFE